MKKPLIASIIVIAIVSAAGLFSIDPVFMMATMMTYLLILDRLEKGEEK